MQEQELTNKNLIYKTITEVGEYQQNNAPFHSIWLTYRILLPKQINYITSGK